MLSNQEIYNERLQGRARTKLECPEVPVNLKTKIKGQGKTYSTSPPPPPPSLCPCCPPLLPFLVIFNIFVYYCLQHRNFVIIYNKLQLAVKYNPVVASLSHSCSIQNTKSLHVCFLRIN